MSNFTEDDVTAGADALMAVEVDWVHGRPIKLSGMLGYAELEKIARAALTECSPAIAARARNDGADEWEALRERTMIHAAEEFRFAVLRAGAIIFNPGRWRR